MEQPIKLLGVERVNGLMLLCAYRSCRRMSPWWRTTSRDWSRNMSMYCVYWVRNRGRGYKTLLKNSDSDSSMLIGWYWAYAQNQPISLLESELIKKVLSPWPQAYTCRVTKPYFFIDIIPSTEQAICLFSGWMVRSNVNGKINNGVKVIQV